MVSELSVQTARHSLDPGQRCFKKKKKSSLQHVSELCEGGRYVSLKWIISIKQEYVSHLSKG